MWVSKEECLKLALESEQEAEIVLDPYLRVQLQEVAEHWRELAQSLSKSTLH